MFMSYALIIVISTIAVVFDSVISTIYSMLGFDPKKKVPAFIWGFIPKFIATIFKHIYISDAFSLFMFVFGAIGTIPIIYLFYDNNLSRGLTKALLLEMAAGIVVSIETVFTQNVLGLTIVQPHLFYPDMMDADITASLIEKVIVSIMFIGTGYIIRYIFRRVKFPPKVCFIGALILWLFIGVEFASGLYYIYTNNTKMSQFDFYILMAMIAVFALTVKLIFDNHAKKAVMRENADLQKLNAMQYEHYAAIEKYNDEIRRMRHDIINHLHTMQVLLSSGEDAECRQYTESLISRFSTGRVTFCENKIIDAVIYNFSAKAAEKQLEFDTDITVPNDISIKQTDIVCIFANILDNALEAAERTENGAVRLNASLIDGQLMIRCENSCPEDIIISNNGIPVTTKKDSINHGLGTKIIKNAVDNYSGSILFDRKDDIFSCVIMLPLEPVSDRPDNFSIHK